MAERSVIRELVTLLGFDVDEKALKEYEKKVDSIRRNLRRMTIAAGIAGAAIAGAVIRTTQLGNNIAKTSKRLGLGVVQLQKYRFAFAQAEVSEQTFDMAVQRAGRRLAEAAKGTGEAVKAVAELNIELKDENGNLRDLDALLMDAFDALSEVENQTDRNRLAMKLFDSEGVRLVQGLEKGNKALKANMKLFGDTGAVISEETAKAAEELSDEWGILMAVMNGMVVGIGAHFLPVVTDLLKALREWFTRYRDLVIVVGSLTIGLIAFSAVVFGALAVTTLWNLKLVVLNATVGALLLKFLIIPAAIGAIIAALAILAEDISIGLSGTGDSVTGRFLKSLPALWYQLKQGFYGYMDAVWERLKVIKAWLLAIPDEFFAGMERLYNRLPAPLRYALEVGAEAAVAGAEALGNIGQDRTPEQNEALARAFGGGRAISGAAKAGSVSVVVHAAPGQTPEAIAGVVTTKLTGADIGATLTGLKR